VKLSTHLALMPRYKKLGLYLRTFICNCFQQLLKLFYNYHNSRNYPWSVIYLKQRFWDWILSSEAETSFIYWAQVSKFHLKTETESSLRNAVFQIKDRTVDNVQNDGSYINIQCAHKVHSVFWKIVARKQIELATCGSRQIIAKLWKFFTDLSRPRCGLCW
jgi:hypothetical protein